jgi:FkbM family methyltransferase
VSIQAFVYRRKLDAPRRAVAFWALLRRALITLMNDPPCTMQIHGRSMNMPLSHELPAYLHQLPLYDALPGRLGRFLRQSRMRLCLIDVGANIGDSITGFGIGTADRVLAVEPNPHFSRYLLQNWPDPAVVSHSSCLCSADSGLENFVIAEDRGTASIRRDDAGTRMQRMPLDQLVSEFEGFEHIDVVKIDTDGHDLEVLAGARGLIQAHKPALLFECDIFGRTDYVAAVHERLRTLLDCGYRTLIVYDNQGYLVGRFELADQAALSRLLFQQLVSPRHYFDLVLLQSPAADAFYASEVEFFIQYGVEPGLQATARFAAALAISTAPA